jgi:hypothetical protein
MKKVMYVALASLAPLALASNVANAVTSHAQSRFWFDSSGNLIGQSILYCSNVTQHKGTAVATNPYFINIQYDCPPDGTANVGYSASIPSQLRNNFCAMYEVCGDDMPSPISDQYLPAPIEIGLYGN